MGFFICAKISKFVSFYEMFRKGLQTFFSSVKVFLRQKPISETDKLNRFLKGGN